MYLNLHKSKPSAPCYSLRSVETGRVVGWRTHLILTRVVFRVNAKARDRVREKKRKEVHAFVIGELADEESTVPEPRVRVTYNPYRTDTFVLAETGVPVHGASYALFNEKGVFIPIPVDP